MTNPEEPSFEQPEPQPEPTTRVIEITIPTGGKAVFRLPADATNRDFIFPGKALAAYGESGAAAPSAARP